MGLTQVDNLSIYMHTIYMNTRFLTKRQAEVYDFLLAHIQKKGYPPSVAEIASHFGFHVGAARGHLLALQNKGYLRIHPNVSRGIEIGHSPLRQPTKSRSVPVVGRIRAGEPIHCLEEIDSEIYIDSELFSYPQLFSLRVTGDSMIEAGILHGDYVIVQPNVAINRGDIAVVLIGEEATVKRVYIDGNEVVLRPENRDMVEVRYKASEVTLIGKVVGVVRKL
jgi:repressor LexA